jgi:hypothetical protein
MALSITIVSRSLRGTLRLSCLYRHTIRSKNNLRQDTWFPARHAKRKGGGGGVLPKGKKPPKPPIPGAILAMRSTSSAPASMSTSASLYVIPPPSLEQATEARRIPEETCGRRRRCGPRRAAGLEVAAGARRRWKRRSVLIGKRPGAQEAKRRRWQRK